MVFRRGKAGSSRLQSLRDGGKMRRAVWLARIGVISRLQSRDCGGGGGLNGARGGRRPRRLECAGGEELHEERRRTWAPETCGLRTDRLVWEGPGRGLAGGSRATSAGPMGPEQPPLPPAFREQGTSAAEWVKAVQGIAAFQKQPWKTIRHSKPCAYTALI